MLDLIRLAEAYEAKANDLPGIAGHAALNAASKLRFAAAAATEADELERQLVNGDEPESLAAVA